VDASEERVARTDENDNGSLLAEFLLGAALLGLLAMLSIAVWNFVLKASASVEEPMSIVAPDNE
jgi:hypothetical protein